MSTKSQQARALFQEGMSVAQIARELDMHYSHASAAVKKLKSQEEIKAVEWSVKKKSFSYLKNALESDNPGKVQLWLATQASNQDWHDIFCDSSVCVIVLKKNDIILSIRQYTRSGTTVSCSCVKETNQIQQELSSIFKDKAMKLVEGEDSVIVKIAL